MKKCMEVAENKATHDAICGYTISFPSVLQSILILNFVRMEIVKYVKKFGRMICASIYSYPIVICSQSDTLSLHTGFYWGKKML